MSDCVEVLRRWTVLLAVVMASLGPNAPCQEQSDQQDSFVVGIRGHYRVGRMAAVRFLGQDVQPTDFAGATLETLDGDGVRVRFRVSETSHFSNNRHVGYVMPGSEGSPLALTLADGRRFETRFPVKDVPSSGPSMIPTEMPWVVAIGDPLGIDRIGASELLDRESRVAVTRIESSTSLPSQSWGYDGVDLLVITGSGAEVLESMSNAQQRALIRWNRQGGRSLICLGESADRLAQVAPWLTELLPVDQIEIATMDPAALETYTTSQTPLDNFKGIKLPRRSGKVLISGRTLRRVATVLAGQYPLGFGRVTVMAADLDSQVFDDWPERTDLVLKLTDEVLSEVNKDQLTTDRATSFNDLAGQMRATLDQFEIKSRFSFSLVSLIVMLLVAAIGPLDYLLVNRLLGRPLLGWLSFPLMAIGLTVFLVTQSKPNLPPEDASLGDGDLLRANQVQVIDIDRIDCVGRAFAWSYTYSHEPANLDVAMPPAADLDSQIGGEYESVIFPMGYPGRTFGGIQLAGENTLLPPYEAVFDSSGMGTLKSLAIASRSSKSIATQIQFAPRVGEKVEVLRRPGSELLRGEIINPLPIDLLDAMLVYRNWVYLLPTRFQAGARLPAVQDLRQKNFRWLLTKQQALEKSATETTPWVVGDFSNVGRVADMLMFHRAAGGTLYTGLKDEPLARLDLSHVLVDDRCMLIGRTESPLIDFGVKPHSSDAQAFFQPDGTSVCLVRVVLPVRSTRLD
ncbi:MAG: hypothetical protein AAFU85_00335 [Planctomycetota bacterium]